MFEALPNDDFRGLYSGIYQQGYTLGNLLASGLFYAIVPTLGWKALFWISSTSGLLVFFLKTEIKDYKLEGQARAYMIKIRKDVKGNWVRFSKDVLSESNESLRSCLFEK